MHFYPLKYNFILKSVFFLQGKYNFLQKKALNLLTNAFSRLHCGRKRQEQSFYPQKHGFNAFFSRLNTTLYKKVFFFSSVNTKNNLILTTFMNKHIIYSQIGTSNFTSRVFDLIDEHLLSGTNEVKLDTFKMMENLVFELQMQSPEIYKNKLSVNTDTNTSSTKQQESVKQCMAKLFKKIKKLFKKTEIVSATLYLQERERELF